jgi:hypothetical protein
LIEKGEWTSSTPATERGAGPIGILKQYAKLDPWRHFSRAASDDLAVLYHMMPRNDEPVVDAANDTISKPVLTANEPC